MCSVRPSPLLHRPVTLNVIDVQIFDVQPFQLTPSNIARHVDRDTRSHFCITLGILEKVQDDLDSFDGPTSLSSGTPLVLGLRGSPDSTAVTAERNTTFVLQNRFEVFLRLIERQILDRFARFTCCLKPHSRI